MLVTSPNQIQWSSDSLVSPERNIELQSYAEDRLGIFPIGYSYLIPVPWTLKTGVNMFAYQTRHIPPDMPFFIHLVVAQDQACRYCYGAARSFLKICGLKEKQIRKLEIDLHSAEIDSSLRRALEFSRKLSRSNPRLVAEDFRQLEQAGFSREATLEIAALAAFYCYFPRMYTPLAIPPDPVEKPTNSPFWRFRKPFMMRAMGRKKKQTKYEVLPNATDAPYHEFISHLDPIPEVSFVYQAALENALSPGVIPRKLKGLIFAIIGHAISCDKTVAAAGTILEKENINRDELKVILEKLSSPLLTSVESKTIQFIRETVRYETPVLQKKTREFSVSVQPAELIEILGTAAIANSISRLTCIMDRSS